MPPVGPGMVWLGNFSEATVQHLPTSLRMGGWFFWQHGKSVPVLWPLLPSWSLPNTDHALEHAALEDVGAAVAVSDEEFREGKVPRRVVPPDKVLPVATIHQSAIQSRWPTL